MNPSVSFETSSKSLDLFHASQKSTIMLEFIANKIKTMVSAVWSSVRQFAVAYDGAFEVPGLCGTSTAREILLDSKVKACASY